MNLLEKARICKQCKIRREYMGKPDDRPKKIENDKDPKIYIIVGKNKFPRPGLETFFAEPTAQQKTSKLGCSCDKVIGTYCSCNKVCTCVPVSSCSCVAHKTCSCVGYKVRTRSKCSCVGYYRRTTGCRCAPVH